MKCEHGGDCQGAQPVQGHNSYGATTHELNGVLCVAKLSSRYRGHDEARDDEEDVNAGVSEVCGAAEYRDSASMHIFGVHHVIDDDRKGCSSAQHLNAE